MRIVHSTAILVVFVTASCTSARTAVPATSADPQRILADISYLASDALEGRGTGTAGNDSAAAFAARRYASLGLRALAPGYLQSFEARPAGHTGSTARLRTQNVVAYLPGSDAALRGQTI